MARALACGPSTCGGNRTDNSSASATGIATMKMIAAAPVSSAPNSHRGTSMKPAPRNAAAPPVAVATEFIVTTCSRGTTSGSAADRPEETNRVNPLTISAPNRIGRSPAPAASSAAMPSTSTSRPRLAPTSTSRRSHRSSSAPANGPSTEYGRYRTANAAAISHGPAARSGLNSSAARQPGLEQAVTELADRPQLEQSPEFGQAAHRPPAGRTRCVVSSSHEIFTVQISRRAARCSPPSIVRW